MTKKKKNWGLRTALSVITLVAYATALGGVPRGKLSPFVRAAAVESSGAAANRAAARGSELCAFVQVGEGGADSALAANGCRVWDRRGDIAIVSIPRHRIMPLAASASIRRIEAGRPCSLTMDTTTTVVNALPVYAGTALPQAFTGEGAVVGVMDVGFDLTHPNFYDATRQRHRIQRLWDQLSKDTVGSLMPVGRTYSSPDEIADLGCTADGFIETHGTHTLGIAAGGGYDSPYRGVAFGSDLCVVANAVSSNAEIVDPNDRYKYTTATDALGFKYIFDYAEQQGKPCVASFSEGYHCGFDSDDSLFCAYLNALTGPGRIVVVSAGNEARTNSGSYLHKPKGTEAAGDYLYGSAKTATLLISGSGYFGVSLYDYAGRKADSVALNVMNLPFDSTVQVPLLLTDGDTLCVAEATTYASAFDEGVTECLLTLKTARPLGQRSVALVLTGKDGEAEARCMASNTIFIPGRGSDTRWHASESTHNVHAPACFPGIIAVGNTVHRPAFTNYLGERCDYTPEGYFEGVINNTSSVGPGINGCTKPDISAPGTNIISSYSSYYLEHNPDASDIKSDVAHFDYNGLTYAWNANTGTSMSCPVVAGVIALWLEACPTLTTDDILCVFSRTAARPDASLIYPNCQYGYGEIKAYEGLLDVLGFTNIQEISRQEATGVSLNMTNGKITLRFDNEPPTTLSLSIYSLSGTKVYDTTVQPQGRRELTVPAVSLPKSVYAVQLSSPAPRMNGSQLVRN